jgi:hypothetical protein
MSLKAVSILLFWSIVYLSTLLVKKTEYVNGIEQILCMF